MPITSLHSESTCVCYFVGFLYLKKKHVCLQYMYIYTHLFYYIYICIYVMHKVLCKYKSIKVSIETYVLFILQQMYLPVEPPSARPCFRCCRPVSGTTKEYTHTHTHTYLWEYKCREGNRSSSMLSLAICTSGATNRPPLPTRHKTCLSHSGGM